ncbi:hypothetical protein I6A84_27980 [Frankia sp. CNm7]|uniref:Effector-associated domain-containing protein n=1 Tax=Frankia nepalensis TaxID=1836974 RepID=A0A937R9G7_9ACTN|nr:effector-associated domain EAD1-containing protein [Frankia nepalensis]MBL7500549.1 hypothetical protein [Frankia nepalensis]MBL7509757.1 hypothetical protein [Frankia nepalensis]MBL7521815.1 hypothetical protein [Frankia nepalensis]MBL7627876.1 hypothetical protein [Frankia nepalensis]
MLTEQEVAELAETFSRPEEIRALLDQIGLTPGQAPGGLGALSALMYWGEVNRELGKGLLPNGADAIRQAVRRRYPHNTVFGDGGAGASRHLTVPTSQAEDAEEADRPSSPYQADPNPTSPKQMKHWSWEHPRGRWLAGAVVVLVSVIVLVTVFNTREGPDPGPRTGGPSTGAPSPSGPPVGGPPTSTTGGEGGTAASGVQDSITSPADGAAVGPWIQASGTSRGLQTGHGLMLMMLVVDLGTYYPWHPLVVEPDGSWKGVIYVGGGANDGTSRELSLVALTPAGLAAIDDYYRRQGASDAVVGIASNQMSADMRVVDSVRITRGPDATSPRLRPVSGPTGDRDLDHFCQWLGDQKAYPAQGYQVAWDTWRCERNGDPAVNDGDPAINMVQACQWAHPDLPIADARPDDENDAQSWKCYALE